MPVLDHDALAASPLADLHTLASELGLDGYRRLRKAQLIEAILEHQGHPDSAGSASAPETEAEAQSGEPDEDAAGDEAPARRRRRGGRGRRRREGDESRDASGTAAPAAPPPAAPVPRSPAAAADEDEERTVEGTVELLGNGSGFVRVSPPEPSDDDVYISAAQVRRCELVSGDAVAGPVRRPRRSERYPSLVRVDTINGAPADQVAAGTRWEDLPAAYPIERLAMGGDDPTVRAAEWLTPFGKGSRVTICGRAWSGKSETLRRLAAALAGIEGLELTLVLAGVRPEEITEWAAGELSPAGATSFAASADAQAGAVERALDQARRVAARGGDAILVVDTLDGLPALAARRVLGAARNIADGGSLTVIVTAGAPLGGETTIIALDLGLTSTGRFPALDLAASGTIRPELLVGEAGATAIANARAQALEA